MELSKKAGYIKGLMAGLKISEETPEGMVLHAMADLLEEMADEIEAIDEPFNPDDYLCGDDNGYDFGGFNDDFDDIPTFGFDHDPFGDDDEPTDNEADDGEPDDDDEHIEMSIESLLNTPDDEAPFGETDDGEPETGNSDTSAASDDKPAWQKAADRFMEGTPEINDEAKAESEEDEETAFECSCPICSCTIEFSQEQYDKGFVKCPQCGETLEFE